MNILIEKKFKSFDTKDIKIVSWNLDIENKNVESKIEEILERDADILMLQECEDNVDDFFQDYISFGKSSSHCGVVCLLIHKRIKPKKIKTYVENGVILAYIKSKHGQLILGSVHLPPFGSINDKILRTTIIYNLVEYLKTEHLLNLPIIIGGDTNMRDDEQISELTDYILDDIYDNFGDENKYHTWPNKTSIYKNKFHKYKTFRFDRFFYSHVSSSTFNTIVSDNSDHLMIETKVEFKNVLFDTINIKLEKLIENHKKNTIYDIDNIDEIDNNEISNNDIIDHIDHINNIKHINKNISIQKC